MPPEKLTKLDVPAAGALPRGGRTRQRLGQQGLPHLGDSRGAEGRVPVARAVASAAGATTSPLPSRVSPSSLPNVSALFPPRPEKKRELVRSRARLERHFADSFITDRACARQVAPALPLRPPTQPLPLTVRPHLVFMWPEPLRRHYGDTVVLSDVRRILPGADPLAPFGSARSLLGVVVRQRLELRVQLMSHDRRARGAAEQLLR